MAAEIRVTSASLRSRREELEQMNRKFLEMVGQLQETAASLASSWEGESHDAFYQAFQNDRTQMENFGTAVQSYAAALEAIITQYETAEMRNLSLAQSRSR